VNDSRAALEERAAKFDFASHREYPFQTLADFAEQESSSLKLLLRAMCKNYASMTVDPHGNILSVRKALVALAWRDFPVELDSSGIPVLTQEIIEALEATK
jgi:hypothetical protein